MSLPAGLSTHRMEWAEYEPWSWLVFLLLLAVYLLGFSGQFHTADEESVLSMAESLAKHARIDTPQRAFAVQIGSPIWSHLRFRQPEHLDLAWVRPVVDGWVLGVFLVLVLACVVALWAVQRRGSLPGIVPLLIVMCIGTMSFAQVRLHDALIASPEVQPWRLLYDTLSAEPRAGDVLFVQDTLGSQLSYSLDESRVTRYHWSPRVIPLDERSAEWVNRSVRSRVWFASDAPAALGTVRVDVAP